MGPAGIGRPEDEREGGRCTHCDEPARLLTCDECGVRRWTINCGHYAQPRPLAAGGEGLSDSRTYCEACAVTDDETCRSVTIYLDSDPLCLGTESTEATFETYARNLVALLRREFGLAEIIVRHQIGGWRWRCSDDSQVDARIREIEQGDEWLELLD